MRQRRRRGERVKDLSGSGILVCEECGERIVLEGPISAWLSGSTSFECECGERLTSAEHLVDESGSATNASSPLYP
jgi:hypothetical protein